MQSIFSPADRRSRQAAVPPGNPSVAHEFPGNPLAGRASECLAGVCDSCLGSTQNQDFAFVAAGLVLSNRAAVAVGAVSDGAILAAQQTTCVRAALPLASVAFNSPARRHRRPAAPCVSQRSEGCEMKPHARRRPNLLVLWAVCAAVLIGRAYTAHGEGGEPRYFAVKNARIVPVSGPVIENGTVVIAKGLIQSVGTDVAIPPEAWVIDGKGLTVYPGLIDAGTNLGLAQDDEAKKRGTGPSASGPEDRPATTPWRVAADELKTDDKRIESWRSAGFTTAL